VEDWVGPYKKELDGCILEGETQALRELFGEERGGVLKKKIAVRMRANPEEKKDGNNRFRLLVMGNEEPEEWTKGGKDSPVASMDSIRMLGHETCGKGGSGTADMAEAS